MKRPKIIAEKRETLGRKVKKLRREGLLPANLYGKKIKSLALQLKIDDFQKIWREAGETGLVEVEIEEKIHPVLIHNVQIHPVSGFPLHVDFHEVSLTEKTTARVPIELVGESPAVEQKIGVLIQPLSEVEVEALPADLPEKLTVDISGLTEVDHAVTVADILLDKERVKILAELKEVVAKVVASTKEEIVVPPPTEEVVSAEEGVAPVEGALAEGAPVGEKTPVEGEPS